MLLIVRRHNKYFRPGTWVECFDDGCRKVEVEASNGRLKVKEEVGLIVPKAEVEPYAMRILKKGFDNDRK